jgi:hypothetical protein
MNKVRRVQPNLKDPQFPKWETPQSPVGFIVGILLWIIMLLGFLFLFYVQLFSYYTRYLLSFINKNIKAIPFWLSILMVVFLFPFTLGIIIVGALTKLLRD